MLNFIIHSFYLKKSIKSGFYVDFIFKSLSLHLLNNQFNWASIFILEKFFIEYLSRYFINSLSIGSWSYSSNQSINYSFIIYIVTLSLFL